MITNEKNMITKEKTGLQMKKKMITNEKNDYK